MPDPANITGNSNIDRAFDIVSRVISGDLSLEQGLTQFEQLIRGESGVDQLMKTPSPIDRFGAPQGSTYTVKPGDNLTKIAAAHGTTWQELARINGIANPNLIQPNQQLRLPTGAQASANYTVQRGDTLSQIAQANGVSTAALARANNIANPNRIFAGQNLAIPGRTQAGTVPNTAQNTGANPRPNPQAPGDVQRPNGAQPLSPAGGTTTGQINLDRLLDSSQGSRALGAIIIGNAEGTRTPTGGTTRAYCGHIDPGNRVANVGSFSLQNAGGRGPEAADRTQLGRLAAQRPAYEAAARRAGLDPNNATLATAYFDLYNQSPMAAGRFLNQMGRLSQSGISQQSVTQLRVDSFINPATGTRYQGAAGGFVNIARDRLGRAPSAAEIRDVVVGDQSRRQRAMVQAMDAQGVNRGVTAANTGQPARARPANDSAPTNDVAPAGDARPARPGQIVNPTGGGIRSDNGGDGHFGASRTGHVHAGLDIVSTPGQNVRAPISGVLTSAPPSSTKPFGGFRITADDGTVVKVFYAQINPGMIGQRVNAGDNVARAQDLQMPGGYSRNVGDHVHVEVWRNGRQTDPAPLILR